LSLTLNITCYGIFSLHISFKKKGTIPKKHNLKNKIDSKLKNSKTIPKSSSIKLTWVGGFVISSLHFKHMVMANCNALDNNQWLLYWFKTHAFTIG
jgi:hypothetical protein